MTLYTSIRRTAKARALATNAAYYILAVSAVVLITAASILAVS